MLMLLKIQLHFLYNQNKLIFIEQNVKDALNTHATQWFDQQVSLM